MTIKRTTRMTLLACAGVASLGLLVGASPAAAKTKTKTFDKCVSGGVAIPDEGATGQPTPSASFSVPVNVPKFKGKPQDGQVTAFTSVDLRITHTFDSDLVLNLVSPGGRVVGLAEQRGGSGDGFGTGPGCGGAPVFYTDTAATPIATPGNTGNNPIAGTFRPEQPLSTFVGGPARGLWTLVATDTAGGDVGTIDGLSLHFTYRYKVKPKKK
jgi:subtilisin-like proprotein convertase family protein